MKNRSRYEVIAAILKSIDGETTRTKILYRAMLSNEQCKLYLHSLLMTGLVQETMHGNRLVYGITPRGERFLSYYIHLGELLPTIIRENFAEEYHEVSA